MNKQNGNRLKDTENKQTDVCDPHAFTSSGCCHENATDWVPCEWQKAISHTSGGWRSKVRAPGLLRSSENPLLGCRLPTCHGILTWQGAETGSHLSWDLYQDTDPIHEDCILPTSSDPHRVSKAPPPSTIMWRGAGFQHMIWLGEWGDKTFSL